MEFFDLYPWLLVPVIFVARLLDVSMATVRTILVIRGHAYLAAGLGFIEVIIWVVAAGQVLTRLDAWYLAVSYAGGFAVGNIVGIWLESKLALGLELVRIVSEDVKIRMADSLRAREYSIVELQGSGERGNPVEIVFVIERRKRIKRLMDEIEGIDPNAFCTVSDIKSHVSVSALERAGRGRSRRMAFKSK